MRHRARLPSSGFLRIGPVAYDSACCARHADRGTENGLKRLRIRKRLGRAKTERGSEKTESRKRGEGTKVGREHRQFRTVSLLIVALAGGLVLESIAANPAELTLVQAWELARQHRSVEAIGDAAVSREAGYVRQGGVRPNPTFSFQTENWRFSGRQDFSPSADVDWFAYWTLPWEWSKKRQSRVAVAEQRRRRVELEKEAALWSLRLDVKRAFHEVAAAQQEREAVREQRDLQGRRRDYFAKRLQVGDIGELDLLQADLEWRRWQLELEQAEERVAGAWAALGRVLGVAHLEARYARVEAPDWIAIEESGVLEDEMIRKAWSQRMELRLLQAALEEQEAQVSLEVAQRRPDWDIVLGYKRTEGYDTLLAGIAVPVPWFDRNEGNVAAARAELERLRLSFQEKRNEVAGSVREALRAFRRAYFWWRRLEEEILPRAEEGRRIVEAAYAEGRIDFLRLLDAERTVAEIKWETTRAQAEVVRTWIDLEEAVGGEGFAVSPRVLAPVPEEEAAAEP